MILGMSFSTFTLFHVILSLVGIGAGLVVLIGMFVSRKLEAWTALFLGTTVLTSVTGYFFPFDQILPSHIVGAVSLVVLAIALYALNARHLAAHWRWIYVVAAVASLYPDVFVAGRSGLPQNPAPPGPGPAPARTPLRHPPQSAPAPFFPPR